MEARSARAPLIDSFFALTAAEVSIPHSIW